MSHFTVAVFSKDEDDIESLLEPFNENVYAGSEYAKFVEDDDYDFDEVSGKCGYWTNPDAKWDWWTLGGRWSGLLKLKDGTTADTALVRDCCFDGDPEEYRKAIRFWEVIVDHDQLKDGEVESDFDSWYKPEYFKEQYGDKETYARHISEFSTYAFLTPEGEWFETGRMGWWGMDDATKDTRDDYRSAFNAYLKKAKQQNLYITIVDCHI